MSRHRPHLAAALALLCGCRLFGPRTPAPERALASEADDPPHAAAAATPDAAAAAGDQPEVDEEPDLRVVDEPAVEPEPADLGNGGGHGSPASRYASLDRSSCEAELEHRKISFDRVPEARGVVAPLRLTGPLSGVTFRSNLPSAKARTSPYDIYDCRLVLALDDFARILSQHEIVEVVHLSVYRPVSSKVALKGAGRRHSGALAIDAAIFKTKDGRVLSVEKDFQPRRIGVRPCPGPKDASQLRRIACAAHAARLFNVVLTPNFNRAHRNHFHLEVTAGVGWTLVR